MKKVLAPLMNISEEDVSIKATTNEKLGYVGREEGVCSYAVALIQKDNLSAKNYYDFRRFSFAFE